MEHSENIGRQEILYRYAAQKAVEDIRNNRDFASNLLQMLHAYPLFNYCRQEITEDDKSILKDMAANENKDLSLRRFCLKLLKQFEQQPDIKEFFHTLWDQSSDYEIKLEVLWSLLSYSDLSEDIYAGISKHFDAADWDKWLPLIVEKLEGDAEEKTHVKELMKRYFHL